MVDKKTRVVIEAEAKGFEKAHREVSKTMGALDTGKAERGFKNLTKFTGELGAQFKNLQRTMREVNDSLRMREGGESVRKLTTDVARLNAEVQRLQDKLKAKPGQQRRRGFGMGLAQGLGIGEYFPEEGLRANIAGRMLGRGARWGGRFPGGLVRAGVGGAFTGAQGLSSGLAGIPVVGGFLSGQLQSALAAAQSNLAVRQQRMGMLQFQTLGGVSTALDKGQKAFETGGIGDASFKAAKAAHMARSRSLLISRKVSTGDAKQIAIAQLMSSNAGYTSGMAEDVYNQWSKDQKESAHSLAIDFARNYKKKEHLADANTAADKARKAVMGKDAAARGAARRGAMNKILRSPFDTIRGAGLEYMGVSEQQANQFAQQLLQMSGGGFQDFQGPQGGRFLETAMAAQTRFGIGADVSGAFARGRRGGLVGGGAGPEGMAAAMQQAISLGLQGSDMTNFMRQMAQGIMSWEQTGIPINPDSIGQLGREVQGRGLAQTRSAAFARGLLGVGQQMAGGGPQNAAQFLLLRDLYGYQGGGLQDFMSAMDRAEQQLPIEGGFEKLMQSITHGRTGAQGTARVLQYFRSGLGVNIGLTEARKLLANDPEAQQRLSGQMAAASGMDAETIRAQAAGLIDPAVKRAAGQENLRAALGGTVLPAMQNLESVQLNMMKNFTEVSGTINRVTKQMEQFSKDSNKTAKRIANLVEFIEVKIAGWPGF